VFAFVRRHGASLAGAEQIARLVGYDRATVGSALEFLAGKGLVERSRNSNGVRMYRLSRLAPDDPRQRCLQELNGEELKNAGHQREFRLQLIDHLSRNAKGNERRRGSGGLHLA
jgi:DNA-binding MarR family transcriptional regulator